MAAQGDQADFAGRDELARRKTIADLLRFNIRPIEIMQRTGFSRDQIKRVRRRLQNGESMARRKGSGSYKRTSGIGQDHVAATALENPRWTSKAIARSLATQVPDEEVSSRTVCRILHDLNFRHGPMWKKFHLTERHMKDRVVWSLLHQDDGWDTTLFLDESCFAMTPNGVRCWYPAGARAPILPVAQYPDKVHVLGAIASVGTVGPLVFTPPGQAWTAERVISALNDHILPMAGVFYGAGQFRTQLDNAAPHTANATRAYCEAAGANLLYQPAHSPDLQPIENVWGLMKRRISQRADVVTTQDLRQAINEEWERLTPLDLAPFVESMPNRLTECLANGGAQTHY